jgi:hypothetical protein
MCDFTIRELANMTYEHHVSQFQPPEDEDQPSIEEQINKFDEKIGQCVPADKKAMAKFRAMMIANGMDPDAKPELSPELKAKMDRDTQASNIDLLFSDALDGREQRGRQLRGSDYEFDE